MTLDQLVSIISAVAWPLAVLVIVFGLRAEVRSVLKRTESAKLPGGTEISFGKSAADLRSASKGRRKLEAGEVGKNEWGNSANTYWLGHDIMWTIDAVLRGATRDDIIYGLRQSLHHLREVGLTDSPFAQELDALVGQAIETEEAEWTIGLRQLFSADLRRLSDRIGAVAEYQHPEFRSGPE